jgi:hypothetical protein
LLQLELFFALIWVACRIVVWVKQRRIEWKREAVLSQLAQIKGVAEESRAFYEKMISADASK